MAPECSGCDLDWCGPIEVRFWQHLALLQFDSLRGQPWNAERCERTRKTLGPRCHVRLPFHHLLLRHDVTWRCQFTWQQGLRSTFLRNLIYGRVRHAYQALGYERQTRHSLIPNCAMKSMRWSPIGDVWNHSMTMITYMGEMHRNQVKLGNVIRNKYIHKIPQATSWGLKKRETSFRCGTRLFAKVTWSLSLNGSPFPNGTSTIGGKQPLGRRLLQRSWSWRHA